MFRALVLTVVTLATLLATGGVRPAAACDCAMPGVEVLPRLGKPAPINTHVRIFLPAGNARTVTVTLRPDQDGAAVPVDSRHLGLADQRIIELVPRAPLAPNTRYQVLMTSPGGREAVVGEFRTGTTADGAIPRWAGLSGAAFVHAPRACCGRCVTGDPYAVLFTGPATDAGTPDAGLLFAVWASDPGGRIDYEKPPLLYAHAWKGRLLLGHPSICTPANFGFPTGGRMFLGVRAVDLAGNLSAPATITLDLAHPLTEEPAAPPRTAGANPEEASGASAPEPAPASQPVPSSQPTSAG